MNRFDLDDMREHAYRRLDEGKTVEQVRLSLAETFDKFRFTVESDGSIFAVPVEQDHIKPTRIF